MWGWIRVLPDPAFDFGDACKKRNPWKRPPPAWRRPMRGLRARKWNPREDSNPDLGPFKAGLNALREDIK